MVFENREELQAFIMGTMSDKFNRESLNCELSKVQLNSRIISQKSLTPGAQKTLLVKRVLGNNVAITIGFLDNAGKIRFTPDNIPCGIEITSPGIDSKIADLFGSSDTTII